MIDNRLVESWERTRSHLSRAWVELPPGDGSDLIECNEFLDHNELELAMDVLAGVGVKRRGGEAFWHALAAAATEMNLEPKADAFNQFAVALPTTFDPGVIPRATWK